MADFDSVEALDLHFAQRIAATPETDRLTVQLEQAQARAGFFEGLSKKAQRDNWSAAALAEFPQANISDLRGESEAEIKDAAKAAHERIQSAVAAREAEIRAELEKSIGKAAYAGAASGGGTPITDTNSPEALAERGAQSFNNRSREGARRAPGLNQSDLRGRQNAHLDAILYKAIGQ